MKAVGKNIPASVTFRAHLGIHILLSLCLCLKYQLTQCYDQHTGSNQQITTHRKLTDRCAHSYKPFSVYPELSVMHSQTSR